MAYTIVTLAQQPNLEDAFRRLDSSEWPHFMLQGAVPRHYRESFFTIFANLQIAIIDDCSTIVAIGSAISTAWNGTQEELPNGWDAVLEQGVYNYEQGLANTLVGMSVTVARKYQRQGYGSKVLSAMRYIAVERGFTSLIIPARPILKSCYPLTPMSRYIEWKRTDGSPFDPWLHTHYRLGAKPICIAPESMVITGKVTEWEQWTGLKFMESGPYIVPGALQPVVIDCDRDIGRYNDPNIWVHYQLNNQGS